MTVSLLPCACGRLNLAPGVYAQSDPVDGIHRPTVCDAQKIIVNVTPDLPPPARYFIARDPHEPCLWVQHGDEPPICLVRITEVPQDAWRLLSSHPETATGGHWCPSCERFVVDVDPADVGHLEVVAHHRLGNCA